MDAVDNCPNIHCNEKLPLSGIQCPVCTEFIGRPNVRRAMAEQQDLQSRYESSLTSVKLRGVLSIAKAFEKEVTNSNAVMARNFKQLTIMFDDDNLLLSTFNQQVASNARMAESNKFDESRESFESKIYPYDFQDIHYAALSLNDIGLSYYGNCHIKFNTKLIRNRASVFEENPCIFLTRHNITGHMPLPKGYRATWNERGKLALSKLHAKITKETSKTDFQDILVYENQKEQSTSDCIEVHIHGKIHIKIFEKITLIGELNTVDNALYNVYEPLLKQQGILLGRMS